MTLNWFERWFVLPKAHDRVTIEQVFATLLNAASMFSHFGKGAVASGLEKIVLDAVAKAGVTADAELAPAAAAISGFIAAGLRPEGAIGDVAAAAIDSAVTQSIEEHGPAGVQAVVDGITHVLQGLFKVL